jgi:hypothetical protein
MAPALRGTAGLLALLGAGLLAGCLQLSPAGATFTSEPPGARVLVDGKDSGHVTPCEMFLERGHTYNVTIALEGYAPRSYVLQAERSYAAVTWPLGVNGAKSTVRFPLLLPWGDLFFPFRETDRLTPGRLFVRLRPADAQ